MVNFGKTPGAFAIVKQVVKQRGVAGLFKGQALTLLRDVPGVSAWYFTNEMMLRAQQRPGEKVPSPFALKNLVSIVHVLTTCINSYTC